MLKFLQTIYATSLLMNKYSVTSVFTRAFSLLILFSNDKIQLTVNNSLANESCSKLNEEINNLLSDATLSKVILFLN